MILPSEAWWVMMQLVWHLVDPGAAALGSCESWQSQTQ